MRILQSTAARLMAKGVLAAGLAVTDMTRPCALVSSFLSNLANWAPKVNTLAPLGRNLPLFDVRYKQTAAAAAKK